MSKHPVLGFLTSKPNRFVSVTILILILLAACSPEQETPIEITRVVVETVTVEGESVEVTQGNVPPEAEPAAEGELEPPAATGSEDDAGPLPSQPNSGPKVAGSRGTAPTTINRLAEAPAATTLRATQINSSPGPQLTTVSSTSLTPTERPKQCRLINDIYKKQCE